VVRRTVVLLAVLPALLLVATSCGSASGGDSEADQLTPPPGDTCHDLASADLEQQTDPRPAVACSRRHTTQTFAVGTLPRDTGRAYDDRRHGGFVFTTCSRAFRDYLGVDDSLAMRVQLRWAWFRPSKQAWDRGARWYRCDVVGGGAESTSYVDLPRTAQGLLAEQPANDDWMACVNGTSVQGAPRIPCSQKHTWRAVTTIKVGDPGDPYPGDKAVEATTRDYCSSSVGAWLGYPEDYDFGYTWFHEAEWNAGNRRSVCWAATTA